jgi:hypothetical protein
MKQILSDNYYLIVFIYLSIFVILKLSSDYYNSKNKPFWNYYTKNLLKFKTSLRFVNKTTFFEEYVLLYNILLVIFYLLLFTSIIIVIYCF